MHVINKHSRITKFMLILEVSMSFKQGQEQQTSYMDGVKVKISERYKPPPKISLPTSYSQRLSLNHHIQDNIPIYDFSFEKNAKECMKALREAKSIASVQRKERLDKIKEIRAQEIANKLKQEQECKSDASVQNEDGTYKINNTEEVDANNLSTYASSTGVLIPTQVPSIYTNILTPTPLTDANTQLCSRQAMDKSPFNISDFEADTSSPFDNMALKTINDMAELAIVLQNEDKNNKQKYSYTPNNAASYTQTYANYSGNQSYNFPELPSTSAAAYVQPASSVYSASNGYYYNIMPTTYDSSYLYNNTVQHDYNNSFETASPEKISEDDTIRIKTVPDIMKALETELHNTHINKINHPITSITRNKERLNSESKSDVDEAFKNLPKNLQVLSINISSMGFPLDRVSRACNVLGDDQKKVVEHLLAMSDLLDLGFSETQVSSALLQCDNDRDKALDKLIL